MCVAGSVAGAEAGGAGVTVLGLWGADGQAADLAVCTVHHLHKLATPKKEGGPVLIVFTGNASLSRAFHRNIHPQQSGVSKRGNELALYHGSQVVL